MTKPLGYYIGSLDSGDWTGALRERFGDYLELMNFQHKLATRACLAYYMFHQEVVQNSLGEYSLHQCALDTLAGWTEVNGDALEFCEIVNNATYSDLECLIEWITSDNILWGNQ